MVIPIIVAIPSINDRLRFDPKFRVAAVPTLDPSLWTTTPDPVATIPVNLEPSPTKFVAVITPEYSALPLSVKVIPVPILIVLSIPLRVNDELPIVKIPVILASPTTTRSVVAPPTVTLLNVEIPTDIPRLEVLPSPSV